ncbi:MAG: ferric reductase-like transmembrane domain-containing protein [Burkholderiales bacterium]|nr:ferric reductase-like transmembrane domain-containing protein [Burkholderiales bacterium]MDE2287116.1 ferric reductase-like transmembrane domain-containing protein [Burkholderiales bacterium]MDE2610096.1 ferric reductase-like transmembrane domain-containing protein [Burkholderiales bacterium]
MFASKADEAALWRLLLIVTSLIVALWWPSAARDLSSMPPSIAVLAREAIVLSGVWAYVLLTLAIVVVMRWRWIEKPLGGLDRCYRLHKWAGIATGAVVLLHCVLEWLPGGLARARAAQPETLPRQPGLDWNAATQEMAELANGTLLCALIAIALLRSIPYRWFRKTHRLSALLYLATTWHALLLLPAQLRFTPLGALVGLCALLGCAAAVVSATGGVGRHRRVRATITGLETHDGMLEVECTLDAHGLPHRPGQFAYVCFDPAEGPHPFTIAGADPQARKIRFVIKALGDYTRQLASRLAEGQQVTIEGPYGGFDFRGTAREQVWVAGGIGLTPFLARLEYLRWLGLHSPSVTFFYCTGDAAKDPYVSRLRALCAQTGVRLVLVDGARQRPLDFDAIAEGLQDPAGAELWFCGPARFGAALQRAWRATGLPGRRFHREWFEMR